MAVQPFDLIVLAAGKGTRLKSETPKVLHPLMGRPVLYRVLQPFHQLPVQTAYVVIGHGAEPVSQSLSQWTFPFSIKTVMQDPPRGTGDAVRCVRDFIFQRNGKGGSHGYEAPKHVVVVAGDAPLFRPETFEDLVNSHQDGDYAITLLTAKQSNPTGYGRVVTEDYMGQERVVKIVEEKDASEGEKAIKIVNTGVYCMDWKRLIPLLDALDNDNAQGEYYLTDIIALAQDHGWAVGRRHLPDAEEALGINSRVELAQCQGVLNQRILTYWMAEGVTIMDPLTTWISPDVVLGRDTVIYPGTYLEGDVTVGSHCVLGPQTMIQGPASIGNHVSVIYSVLKGGVSVGDHSTVGPFAQLRDGVEIAHHVRIGNFVEVKHSSIDHHSNAAHLAYLGDARLGADVNMGAGSITANYDPIRDLKHTTRIEDGVKVGCNSVIVAPVTLGEYSSVAAGSVVNQDVDPYDLAIARQKQSSLPGWVKKILASLPGGPPPISYTTLTTPSSHNTPQ